MAHTWYRSKVTAHISATDHRPFSHSYGRDMATSLNEDTAIQLPFDDSGNYETEGLVDHSHLMDDHGTDTWNETMFDTDLTQMDDQALPHAATSLFDKTVNGDWRDGRDNEWDNEEFSTGQQSQLQTGGDVSHASGGMPIGSEGVTHGARVLVQSTKSQVYVFMQYHSYFSGTCSFSKCCICFSYCTGN